jgi:flagellar P-ring protein precursor FlgI
VGRVIDRCIIEREIPTIIRPADGLSLALNTPDYTTAVRIADAVNAAFPQTAMAAHAGLVHIDLPVKHRTVDGIGAFWSKVGELKVEPSMPARVVVNERTGTIVIGQNVQLGAAAISHGNLTIKIKETTTTSQPSPFSSRGQTVQDKQTDITAEEEVRRITAIPEATTLGDVTQALNVLGVTPRDMITILQLLKKAGALQCELVVL